MWTRGDVAAAEKKRERRAESIEDYTPCANNTTMIQNTINNTKKDNINTVWDKDNLTMKCPEI